MLVLSVLCLALFGHFGIWIALYNRINATGLNRKTIKRIEKGIVLSCGLIPIIGLGWEWQRSESFGFLLDWRYWSLASQCYIGICVVALFGMAPRWFLDRPQFSLSNDRHQLIHSESLNRVHLEKPEHIAGHSFRRMAHLPANQITSLERNCKKLFVDALPADIAGLRIAHFSDVHFTGQLGNSFYRLAVDWVRDQQPDLIVLSGDIVDYEHALSQIEPVFDGLSARHGMYFILGNHDRRLANPLSVCERLESIGWSDVGRRNSTVSIGRTQLEIIGNEAPWFFRNTDAGTAGGALASLTAGSTGDRFRLGVSHSPDQFGWGISNQCGLLLCGHTHGGQIRFPWIGPVISPSWFGSRYASGVFYGGGKTVMHVSRGVAGVHPFRWGCLPEVSILELAELHPIPL